jgi:hypothetical protein
MMMEIAGIRSEISKHVEAFAHGVHFEITFYPLEVLYGIHFQFDNHELNQRLWKMLRTEHAFDRQNRGFSEDDTIPKKPPWLLATKRVELTGDYWTDAPAIITHGRHFVELVGHWYDVVYSKEMLLAFLHEIGAS